MIGWLSVQTTAQPPKGEVLVVGEVVKAKSGKAEPFVLFGCDDKLERAYYTYDAYPTRALNDERGERNKRRRNSATRGREMQEDVLLVVEAGKSAKEVLLVVETIKAAKAAKSSKAKCKKTKAAKALDKTKAAKVRLSGPHSSL